MKKLISLLLVISLLTLSLFSLAACNNGGDDSEKNEAENDFTQGDDLGNGESGDNEAEDDNSESDKTGDDNTSEIVSPGIRYVKMTVKDHGVIILKLDGNTAPITVDNFITLVNNKFYDGLTFHRIIENFMIQGGDPKGTGSGGSGNPIKGEFSLNGVNNNIEHKRGVISMARSDSYNSASSQFFICNADYPSLNGSYAAFGHVIHGMDVVDSITEYGVQFTTNGVIYDKSYQPTITSMVEMTEEEALSYINSENENESNNNSGIETNSDSCALFGTRNTDGHSLKYVKMSVKDHGDIILLLDATTAPITVNNFMKLVNEGFYDGLTFHRIIKDFVIQGGDPNGDGTGSAEETVKGEFILNGVENDISHLKGVISLARASAYDSGSCQFFICNTNYAYLDGSYAAFGYVISGMSVVDSITAEGIKHSASSSTGTINDKSKQPVITSIVEITEEEALKNTK